MAEIKHTRGKRVLSGLGALTLAVAGLLGGAGAALADDDNSLNVGNIDTNREGSIKIHKHEHQNGSNNTQNPDGSGQSIGTKGIAGVEFTAYQLTDINLGETDDWDKLEDLDLSDACSSIPGHTLGSPITSLATDADGVTTLTGLQIGAYVVCETDAPDEVVDRSQPFVVAIPTPYENAWLYDVNVYPKNGTSSVEKSIDPQSDLGLGGVVNFPVTVTVPNTNGDDLLTKFEVTDTLDTKLGLNGNGVAKVQLGGVDVNSAYYTVSNDGQTVKVTFNADGLKWLKEQGEKKIVVTFSAVVNEVGEITNDATAYINTPNHDSEISSNEVNTNWGDLVVLKTAAGSNATLDRAIFEVYEAETPYAGGTCADAKVKDETNPLSVKGATQFTSKNGGVIKIAGLYVSDSVNEVPNADQRCYVLKEVQAPAGYVTPQGDKAYTGVAVKTGSTAVNVYDASITNQQQDVPELPLTGANGQILMVIGGTAVLLLAGGLVIVSRRRSAREETK